MSKGVMYVDNIRVEYDNEPNVLEVCRKAGVEIPHFCFHSDLSVYGACRMCMVEEEGTGKIDAACTCLLYTSHAAEKARDAERRGKARGQAEQRSRRAAEGRADKECGHDLAALEAAAERNGGKDDLEPVSYTHLDVYKRQALGHRASEEAEADNADCHSLTPLSS